MFGYPVCAAGTADLIGSSHLDQPHQSVYYPLFRAYASHMRRHHKNVTINTVEFSLKNN